MSDITKMASGATGFIARNFGVANWVAILIKYGLLFSIAGGLIWGFADHYYDKGIADCKATIKKQNGLVEGIGDNLEQEGEQANEEFEQQVVDNKAKQDASDIALSIELAFKQGQLEGRADGYRAGLDDGKVDGSHCMHDPVAYSDRVRNGGRSLQGEIFGVGTESGDNLSGPAGDDPVIPNPQRD